MSAFEAEVRNAIKALTSQVTALGASLDKTQGKARAAGDRVAGAFRKGAPAAAAAKQQVDGFGKSIKGAGEALTKMGGPLAEIIGRLTGGAGLAGGLARVAVAAALFGLAVRMGSAVLDAQIERTKKLIEATKELREVRVRAAAEVRQQGVGAVTSQGDDLRLLMGRGGYSAVLQANEVAKTGITSAADARKGVAEAWKVSNAIDRDDVIEAAKDVAGTGEMKFSEAVKAVVDDPTMMSRLKREGGIGAVSSRLVTSARGLKPTATNLSQAAFDVEHNRRGTTEGGLLTGIARTQGALNEIDVVGQRRIRGGQAEAGAKASLSAASDPLGAAMVDLFRRQQESDAELRQLAETQGKVLGFLADIFKPGGSFETQLIRQQNARFGAGG